MIDERVSLVRIKQKTCMLNFGIAPCTATGEKCFNTTATCKDRENINIGTMDLWFCSQRGNLPRPFLLNGQPVYTISSLVSVDIEPTRLNVNAGSNDVAALGNRETAKANILDHIHSDNVVDKYRDERNYIATERGTFWTKWLERNKYYANTEMEIFTGKIGDDLSLFTKRLYIIDSITHNGDAVTITAKDVLKLADDNRALFPQPTTGKLVEEINAAHASKLTLNNTGEYSLTGGTVAIGSENIVYTHAIVVGANIELHTLTRGADGTKADEHKIGDVVQVVANGSNIIPYDLARDLLVSANINTAHIPYDQWVAENSDLITYPVSYNIRTPTGVNKLLGELARDCNFTIYWDSALQKIMLDYTQLNGVAQELSDNNDIIVDTMRSKVMPDRRINELWMFYNVRDASKSLEESGNVRDIKIISEQDAKSAEEYDDRIVRKIYSRYINNDTHALDVAERIMKRYRDAPVVYQFAAKTDKSLRLSDIITIKHWRFVDEFGNIKPKRAQITSFINNTDGTVDIEAESFDLFYTSYNVYMPDDALDYTTGTDATNNSYYTDDDGLLSDGTEGARYQ